MPSVLGTLILTACVGMAVWWTVVRLPRFWRWPQATGSLNAINPAIHARAIPALAVLGTPLGILFVAVIWAVGPLDLRAGPGLAIAWFVVKVWFVALIVVPVAVGITGRPHFAVPPALRGPLRDSPMHDATVYEEVDERRTRFRASCECGWNGLYQATEAEARFEAKLHTSRVRAEVDRLGP